MLNVLVHNSGNVWHHNNASDNRLGFSVTCQLCNQSDVVVELETSQTKGGQTETKLIFNCSCGHIEMYWGYK